MEEVVVVSKQPGPPMWKVSKGDHELWIFGRLSPLPAQMFWESNKVKSVIERSQEYLPAGSISMGTKSPFDVLRIKRAMKRLKKNPNGATLEPDRE